MQNKKLKLVLAVGVSLMVAGFLMCFLAVIIGIVSASSATSPSRESGADMFWLGLGCPSIVLGLITTIAAKVAIWWQG